MSLERQREYVWAWHRKETGINQQGAQNRGGNRTSREKNDMAALNRAEKAQKEASRMGGGCGWPINDTGHNDSKRSDIKASWSLRRQRMAALGNLSGRGFSLSGRGLSLSFFSSLRFFRRCPLQAEKSRHIANDGEIDRQRGKDSTRAREKERDPHTHTHTTRAVWSVALSLYEKLFWAGTTPVPHQCPLDCQSVQDYKD